jgi:tyrosyl-tRNA synthetase
MNAFLADATARGFIHQCTDADALSQALSAGPLSAYVGYDCTADSLHVGSLVSIMLLRLFQKHGHKPVVLMGGGTTRIGDPSGRDETRQMLTDEKIADNMAGIRRAFTNYLTFDDTTPTGAIMVNNADWLDSLGYIQVLREIGPHFTINRMLTMDSVRLRLEREQPLTFLEFNYMISQSYDFRELYRRHNVRLQMGGSDQWGNITAGADLVRRTDAAQIFGLTTPLITTSSGAKMGKTAKGAIWLNADRLSPYDYWQFWRNTEDADVGRFLRLFTELPMGEITRLEDLQGADINEAKKILAFEATALLHGNEAATQAAETARQTFETGDIADTLPTHIVTPDALQAGIPIFRLLVESGLAPSNAEARRLIRGGGARLNDTQITDEGRLVTAHDAQDGAIKLSAGKKQHRLIRAA